MNKPAKIRMIRELHARQAEQLLGIQEFEIQFFEATDCLIEYIDGSVQITGSIPHCPKLNVLVKRRYGVLEPKVLTYRGYAEVSQAELSRDMHAAISTFLSNVSGNVQYYFELRNKYIEIGKKVQSVLRR